MVRVNKPLYITGHSLGAALATLAAVDIAAHYRPRTMEVYTFGGPRVGDPYFAFAHNGLVPVHQRIFNDNDLVVHLPPILYAHKHKLYYYLHARTGIKRTMPMGTQKQNHALETYFNDLASLDPAYTEQICASPPGWCMYRREQPQTQQQLRVNIRAKRG
jgi:triacylglycerol lipase